MNYPTVAIERVVNFREEVRAIYDEFSIGDIDAEEAWANIAYLVETTR